jgi:hypothetical protein
MKKTLLALTCASLALAACGDPAPSIDPRDAVLDAMTAVYEAGTVHQEFEMSMSAGDESFTFTGEGDLDNERQRATMSMDMGMFGGSMDVVLADGVIYMRAPMFEEVGTDWISMDPARMDPAAASQFGGMGTTMDPSAYVGLFAGVVDVEAEGDDEIDGVATTRYAGTIDLGRVLENFAKEAGDEVPAASREQLEAALDQFEALGIASDLPFEIWIDDEGFPRRQRVTMDLGGLVPGDGEASFEMVVDYSAFGEPVDIRVPKRSQVTDLTDSLGGGAGASGSSAAYG